MKTKIDTTIATIKQQIADKKLIAGARLPAIRQMATQLGYSVATIVEAYNRLVSEGILESRLGAGFYVIGSGTPMVMLESTVQYQREIDPLWISRQSLEAKSQVFKPGCGWLPNHWMPENTVRKALKQTAKSDIGLLIDYAVPHGHTGLRQWIARRKHSFELTVDPQQILITDSATQSIDLIFRLLLQPGDVILIDDPCYFNFQALIQAHQLKAVAIPFTAQGPNIERFKQALQLKPKIYLTNSGIHNPTGASLSIQTAFQIAKLAEQADLVIIEDDIFSDFEYQAAPRYAALAGFEQVIQIGSFTKTISAAVRCGYIIASHHQIDRLIDLRIATNFSHSHLNAEILLHALMDSSYNKHIEWLKKQLIKAMNDCIRKLAVLDIHPWLIPKAGIFLWCRLPQGILATELSKYCLQHEVILAPGNAFSQSENAVHFMRFNVAQCIDQHVFDVLKQGILALSRQQEAGIE